MKDYRRHKPEPVVGVPASQEVKMIYGEMSNLTSTGLNTHIWASNSPYDPDVTGAGIQASYYDEWMQFYQRWEVLKCHAHFEFSNNSALPATVAMLKSDNVSFTYNDIEDVISQKSAKYARLSAAGGQDRATINMTMRPRDWLGYGTPTQSLFGGKTSNPSILTYLRMFASNYGETAVNVYVTVKLTYTVKLFDILPLHQSTFNKYTISDSGRKYKHADIQRKYELMQQQRQQKEIDKSISQRSPHIVAMNHNYFTDPEPKSEPAEPDNCGCANCQSVAKSLKC
jgi:hypothetical protein